MHRSLQTIKALGKKAGVFICPSTPEGVLDYVMDMVDLILVMSVNPGFVGQSFNESQLDKIANIRKMIDATGRTIDLEVDGGVKISNAGKVIAAGADVLVAGSAVFTGNPADYAANIEAIRAGTT